MGGGDESSTMKPMRWEGQRHVETDSESFWGARWGGCVMKKDRGRR